MPPSTLPPLARPFVRAAQYTRCPLYWLPLDMPEPRQRQRQWYNAFIAELEKRLTAQELMPASFLQFKHLSDARRDHFIRHSCKLVPVGGMSLVPGRPIVAPPSKDQIEEQVNAGDLDMFKLMPDFCYWILKGRDLTLRLPLFAGGSITQLYVDAADLPVIPIPPGARALIPDMDIDAEVEATVMLGHPFQKLSRELFGEPYQDEVSYGGWSYIVPRLATQDFFSLPEEEIKKLLTLSPVYLNESPADRGVLLAAREPLEPLLNDIAAVLEQQGLAAE